MERPIRFRAKLKIGFKPNEINSCWVYGNFIEGGGAKIGNVAEETICISTCVCDMHGKRAYEGDVIRCYDDHWKEGDETEIMMIRWNAPKFEAVTADNRFSFTSYGKFEIVGNIFDNPELKETFKKVIKCGESNV